MHIITTKKKKKKIINKFKKFTDDNYVNYGFVDIPLEDVISNSENSADSNLINMLENGNRHELVAYITCNDIKDIEKTKPNVKKCIQKNCIAIENKCYTLEEYKNNLVNK